MTENYPSSVLDYIIHIITIGPFKPHLLLQKYISAFDLIIEVISDGTTKLNLSIDAVSFNQVT